MKLFDVKRENFEIFVTRQRPNCTIKKMARRDGLGRIFSFRKKYQLISKLLHSSNFAGKNIQFQIPFIFIRGCGLFRKNLYSYGNTKIYMIRIRPVHKSKKKPEN